MCRRDEIASGCEKAYNHLHVADAKAMMLFDSEKDMLDYASNVSSLVLSNCDAYIDQ